MSKDFPNEETCGACQCTYIAYDGGPKDRCKAHEHMTTIQEEEVKYKYKDISNQELMDRVVALEENNVTLNGRIDDLLELIKAEKPSFEKTCETCKKKFQAAAPAVKKCPKCKGSN